MTHKKEYIVDGEKMSDYNKEYYKKHKNEISKRTKQRLKDNPNYNKDYYVKNKEKHQEWSRQYYIKHREEILKQKKDARDKKKVSIILI